MSHWRHWTPSETVFWCSSPVAPRNSWTPLAWPPGRALSTPYNLRGKFAGFLLTEAATINPRMALQACLTWSAHSVASFALRAAQAATKGSSDWSSRRRTRRLGGHLHRCWRRAAAAARLTPTLLSTAAILCSKRSRTFWSSCVPGHWLRCAFAVRFFETDVAVACGLARSRLHATVTASVSAREQRTATCSAARA